VFRRAALLTVLLAALPGPISSQVRIIQTHAGKGNNVQIIDPATNTVVGEIKDIRANRGAAAAADGATLYFSSEADRTLDVVDVKTLSVTKKIPLNGRPNNIFASKDGRRVYVGINSAPGAVDVIDAVRLERIKSIPTHGGIHNVYLTPDNKHIIAGSISGRKLIVIDAATDQTLWTVFEEGVRPIAFETNPDGSTKRLFVELSNLHGFAVVDFQQRKEVARITLPDIAAEKRDPGPFNAAPAHGIGVAPDGKTLWVCSRPNAAVYAYSLPDLKLIGGVEVGKRPDWLTFTPDSKRVYVASEGSHTVSAIDIASGKEIARIPVGESPKRNITAVLRGRTPETDCRGGKSGDHRKNCE
jgi:YVTN family beta-propeller protein